MDVLRVKSDSLDVVLKTYTAGELPYWTEKLIKHVSVDLLVEPAHDSKP